MKGGRRKIKVRWIKNIKRVKGRSIDLKKRNRSRK